MVSKATRATEEQELEIVTVLSDTLAKFSPRLVTPSFLVYEHEKGEDFCFGKAFVFVQDFYYAEYTEYYYIEGQTKYHYWVSPNDIDKLTSGATFYPYINKFGRLHWKTGQD